MKNTLRLLLIVIIVFAPVVSFAADLLTVYRYALMNDPEFKRARAAYYAATEAYPIARASLLPQLGLNGFTERQFLHFLSPSFSGIQPAAKIDNNESYYDLDLRQSVINFAALYRLKAANAFVKQAGVNYAIAAQDLVLRLAFAYINILQAEETLLLTQAEKKTTKVQLDAAQDRYKVGVDSLTAVYNAQALYDLTAAREISNINEVKNRKEQLRQITCIYFDKIAPLKERFPLVSPKPNDIDQWTQMSERQNFSIIGARFAVMRAREMIKVNVANNLPVINAKARINRQKDSNLDSYLLGQNSLNKAVGFEVKFPMIQGGLVMAETRQAQFEYEQSLDQMEVIYRQVVSNTRQVFNDVMSGISRIKADRQAVFSNQNSLNSTLDALTVGTRTMVDVLLAEQSLYRAKLNLAIDEYDYFKNTLRLKQSAGILTAEDLVCINRWLKTYVH